MLQLIRVSRTQHDSRIPNICGSSELFFRSRSLNQVESLLTSLEKPPIPIGIRRWKIRSCTLLLKPCAFIYTCRWESIRIIQQSLEFHLLEHIVRASCNDNPPHANRIQYSSATSVNSLNRAAGIPYRSRDLEKEPIMSKEDFKAQDIKLLMPFRTTHTHCFHYW